MMKTDNITVDTMLHSVPSKRLKTESLELLPRGVEERLDNIECHLKSNGKSFSTGMTWYKRYHW